MTHCKTLTFEDRFTTMTPSSRVYAYCFTIRFGQLLMSSLKNTSENQLFFSPPLAACILPLKTDTKFLEI